MLKQLLKYDFRSTGRILIPTYCTFMGITIVSYLTNTIFVSFLKDSPVTDIIAAIAFIILILGMSILPMLTLIVLVVDFYKNMVGKGGYLTYTLPTQPHTIMLSKIIMTALWEFIAVILVAISVFVIVCSPQMQAEISLIPQDAEFILSVRFWCILVFGMLVALTSEALIWYFSISLASLFQKHKVIMSFVFYFVSDMTIQILLMIMGFLAGFLAGFFGVTSDSIENMGAEMELFLTLVGIVYLFVGIIGSVVACRIFDKKTNLE